MTLTIERDGPVTTLIRDRHAARNAMDPASAQALTHFYGTDAITFTTTSDTVNGVSGPLTAWQRARMKSA